MELKTEERKNENKVVENKVVENKSENKNESQTKDSILFDEYQKLKKENAQLKEKLKIADAELSTEEKLIEERAKKMYTNVKENKIMFVTLAKNYDYWNSGDELHFFITKDRCKELPEDLSETLQNALQPGNQLLREANDREVMNEMRFRARENLIAEGTIKPKKIIENKLRL